MLRQTKGFTYQVPEPFEAGMTLSHQDAQDLNFYLSDRVRKNVEHWLARLRHTPTQAEVEEEAKRLGEELFLSRRRKESFLGGMEKELERELDKEEARRGKVMTQGERREFRDHYSRDLRTLARAKANHEGRVARTRELIWKLLGEGDSIGQE